MSIDARHVNAFLETTKAVFGTMLNLPVTFEKPVPRPMGDQHDVSGVIGLSGDVVGSVIIGFGRLSAEQIASAFAGTRLVADTPDFADAIGELANLIAGGAKSKLEGLSISISCPSVVIAPGHMITGPSSAAGIRIPCSTPAGRFMIDVTFQASRKAATTAA